MIASMFMRRGECRATYTSPPTSTSTMPLVMRFQVASPTVKRVSPRYGPLSLTS